MARVGGFYRSGNVQDRRIIQFGRRGNLLEIDFNPVNYKASIDFPCVEAFTASDRVIFTDLGNLRENFLSLGLKQL